MKKKLVNIFLILSLIGNAYQYTYLVGYDKNVGIVTSAYEKEQLENFDLNRAIHEKNLLIFDLQYKLTDCRSLIAIIEEEFKGLVAVSHIIGENNGKNIKEEQKEKR